MRLFRVYGQNVALASVLVAAAALPVSAQGTKDEFWPELNVYYNINSTTRLNVENSFNQNQSERNRQGSFAYFLDFALKPLLRRELRSHADVFRRRYLTFRAGYQYTTSFENDDPSSEDRAIIESTARYFLPAGILLSDRNRGEFRFVKAKPFSTRYRNRLRMEHDFKIGGIVCIPYGSGEVFFNTSNNRWTPFRYQAGVQIPTGPRVVFDLYYARQHDTSGTPARINALGLTLNLYF
ncbi:MAG TPA: DUF2490 domain-containing protein [Bryobacteraceae bacterium]|nr:DUF2490 domain-containing protein [Bryobacteraceae bacterium]